MNPFLVCGVEGVTLDADERRMLRELQPGAVILFARNILIADQVRALTAELRGLSFKPVVVVDLEGGKVNRLRPLVGELPSAAAAGAAGKGACRALGEAIGAACAWLGFGAVYAPVVDVAVAGGALGGEERCFAADPNRVAELAAAFLAGVEDWGVDTCLKHYPGLGGGAVDSHLELPVLGGEAREHRRVFGALAGPGRAVMVAHALAPALGEALAPASLSRVVVSRLDGWEGGPVVADDLEMGALVGFGSVPERAAAALLAGCDQVLVCNALDQRAPVVDHLRRWAARDPVLAAALGRSHRRFAAWGRRPLRVASEVDVLSRAARARELAGERP